MTTAGKQLGFLTENMETIKEIYLKAKNLLTAAGIADAAISAAQILKKHSGLERHEITLHGNDAAQFDTTAFFADVKRRVKREPLQYIIGMWPFYDLDFYVGDGVLIPRPDTEILCETAIDFLKTRKNPALIELCAGSGCVSTVAAKNVENLKLCCVELSDAALFYLNKNLAYHGLTESAEVVKADVLKKETVKRLPQKVDAIICNPPYIKSDDIKALEPEVAEFEPKMALDGGYDGLIFYRTAENYLSLLSDGGMAAFEVGIGESRDVADLLRSFGLRDIFIKKDFGGIERVVGGYR